MTVGLWKVSVKLELVTNQNIIQVPLDYAEPHIGSASIALIKYPAKVPADHKEYKGPIIFNFGV